MKKGVLFALFVFVLFAGVALAQEPVCTDGNEPAAWVATNPLPTNTARVTYDNGIVYAVGRTDIVSGQVFSNGQISNWQPAGSLSYTRQDPAPVISGTTLYIIGGYYAETEYRDHVVEYGQIQNGVVTDWQTTTQTIYGRVGSRAIISGTYVYVAGGVDWSAQFATERAPIMADGSLGSWEETTDPVPGANPFINEYFYRLAQSGLLERSPDNTTWHPVNKGTSRYQPDLLVIGNNLYVFGGGATAVEFWNTTTPPTPSDYGLTINDGALFTNQITVTLTIGQPPMWNKLVQVSNDGGFAGATWQPYQPCKAWQITSYGSSVIPRTVYARWKNPETGEIFGPFSDDIIWDGRPPEGTVTIEDLQPASLARAENVTTAAAYTYYLPLLFKDGAEANVTLILAASDDVSGVAEMRVSSEPGGGSWQAYREAVPWYLEDGGRVYAQFRDYAGNESKVVSAGR